MKAVAIPIDPQILQLVELVTNGLESPQTRRAYQRDITDFLEWWHDRGKPPLSKGELDKFKANQRKHQRGTSAINRSLAAVRRFIREAADNNLIDQREAESACKVKGVIHSGNKAGMWLTLEESRLLINAPPIDTLRGMRDRMVLSVLVGGGLRRSELESLSISHLQQRDGRWIIYDIIGKRNKVRTIPIANWVYDSIARWVHAAKIEKGNIFIGVHFAKGEEYLRPFPSREAATQEIWRIVDRYKSAVGKQSLAPHDLRRTYAKLARSAGAQLEQIQLTLGHNSLQTTEKYLGTALDYKRSPSDLIDLE